MEENKQSDKNITSTSYSTDVNLSIKNGQVQNLKKINKTNQNTRNENWCHVVDEK